MIKQKCHNCGYELKPSSKRKGFWCVINKVTAWFHSKSCFVSWAKQYKGKYEGGIINETPNDVK